MPATEVILLGVKLDATGVDAQLSQPDGNYLGRTAYAQPFIRDTGVINIWNMVFDATFRRTTDNAASPQLYSLQGVTNKNAARVESGLILFPADVPQEFCAIMTDIAPSPAMGKWSYFQEFTSAQINPPYFWVNDDAVVGPIEDQTYLSGTYHVPMANAQSTENPTNMYLPRNVDYRLKHWGVKTVA